MHTAPGLYDAMPAEVYHGDPCPAPSLSSGVARTLITKSPAHAYLEHRRLGGAKDDPTEDMILGGFVHALLASDTSDFEVRDFDNYQTKDARAWRDAVTASGKTPILEKNTYRARLIAKALREKLAPDLSVNPFASGKPEVTAIWQEGDFWFRARYDRLILETGDDGIWDWKSTSDASPAAIVQTIINKGYHIQAAHYLRGLEKLRPADMGRYHFTLGFVETEPPFAVRRVRMTEAFLGLGRQLLNGAISEWQQCLTSNKWPDRSAAPLLIEPPTWYAMRVAEDAA